MDERHLQLQNLLYEKDHLQRTTTALRDLPLAELRRAEREEEGAALLQLREEDHAPVPPEEHRRNLLQLQEARERRKALHEEVAAAQARKQARAAELQRLREALGVGIPRQIEDLEAVCKGIREKHPELPVALPFAGVEPEELRGLPQPLYQLLGRLLAYCQAVDPERRRLRASLVTPQQDPSSFPASVVLGGGMAAANGDNGMDVEGEEDGRGGSASAGGAALEVHPQAVKLEALWVPEGQEDAAPPVASADPKDVDVVLFFVPAAGSGHSGHEALVWVPNRHPAALVNLLPGDTGGAVASASAGGPVQLGSSASLAGSGSRKRRPSSSTARAGAGGDDDSSAGAVAHSFLWLQWLSGASPFPAHYLELSAALSSTCILDRLRARLRAQRQLDAFLDGLAKKPAAVPVDAALVAAGGSPALILGGSGGAGSAGGWEVVAFAEVPSLVGSEGDPFADPACGVQAVLGEAAEAGGASGGAEQDDEEDGENGATLSVSAGAGVQRKGASADATAAGAWERAGARAFAVTVRKRSVGDIQLLVEVSPEYPLRPPRFRLSAAQTAGKKSFSNAYASVLLEVNAHYDDVLAPGGGAGPARDWLLPHQLKKLLFCLNVMELGTASFGNTAGRMRWGKDRRRAVSVDVHARLLMPR